MANANSKGARCANNAEGIPTGIYLRASSPDQTESIDAQRMLLERYAADHGLHIVIEHSDFAMGLLEDETGSLAGFARVLTDRVYKALVFDLIVAESFRGRQLGRRLMQAILEHPDLLQVRHFELYCLPEMARFYEQWGFTTALGGVALMRLER